jgi:CRP-like cAMP-binding protein
VPINREYDSLAPAVSGIALQHFAAGEKVIRQGQIGQALYIIVAGVALMSSRDLDGHERQIRSLRNGEFLVKMPSFAREIGRILEIHRAAIQVCSQPPAPSVPIDDVKDKGTELIGAHQH